MGYLTPAAVTLARRRFAFSFLAVASLAIPSVPALAQCPESTLKFPAPGTLTTSEQIFDVASTEGCWIRGDHRFGDYSLHHAGYVQPTDVIARDRFEVTGVPPGTQVSVTVRLVVNGWVFTGGCGGTGCCGYLRAAIRAGGADSASADLGAQTFGGRKDFSGVVEVPITLTAGTPRDLEVELYARRCAGGAGHTVDATGHITFDRTDPRALVVSCKGFGPAVVPVLRRSWGQLKTIYR